MRELAFVGLSDDGTALVLSGPDGTRYTVPCDDRLEAAMRRDRTRLGQMEIALDGTTPKDIQQRVRFGQTPEEISDSSGIPLERVLRFAGPVHRRARSTSPRRRARSSCATAAPSRTLEATVIDTLALGGADPELVEWDAWRREDGRWSLLASWEPVDGGRARRHRRALGLRPGRPHRRRRRPGERVAARRPARSDPEADDTDTRPHLVGLPVARRARHVGRRLGRPRRRVHGDRRARLRARRSSTSPTVRRPSPTTTRRSTTSTTPCPASRDPRARSSRRARRKAARADAGARSATWRRAASRAPRCRAGTRSCSAPATPRADGSASAARRSAALGARRHRPRRVGDPLRPRAGVERRRRCRSQCEREHRVRRGDARPAVTPRPARPACTPSAANRAASSSRRPEPARRRSSVVAGRRVQRTRDVAGDAGRPARSRRGSAPRRARRAATPSRAMRRSAVGVEHRQPGDVGGEAARRRRARRRRTARPSSPVATSAPGRAPRGEAAVEQADVVVAVVAQQPPGARGDRAVAAVGDDDAGGRA